MNGAPVCAVKLPPACHCPNAGVQQPIRHRPVAGFEQCELVHKTHHGTLAMVKARTRLFRCGVIHTFCGAVFSFNVVPGSEASSMECDQVQRLRQTSALLVKRRLKLSGSAL